MSEEKKPASRRYYKCRNKDGKTVRVVSAHNPASAIRHVSRDDWSAEVCSQQDLVELCVLGDVKIEQAGSVVAEQESLALEGAEA